VPHVHVHAPHELTEPQGHGDEKSGGPDRTERLLELYAILLLALTTLATAWSGYQAARWSGEQSQSFARASTMRIKAQAQSTLAGQLRIDDLVMFNSWLDAREAGNGELAAIYRRRFREAFVPAFEAWLAQRPFTSGSAVPVPGPLYMPEYRLAETARSSELDARADELYREGTSAKTNDDHYILSTLFFAAVLFFAGISLRLDWRPLRYGVLGMGSVLLLVGVGYVVTLPVV
jgi:hypothetical protein